MKKSIIISLLTIMLISVSSSQVISININNEEKILHTLDTDIIFIDKNNTIGPWDGTIDNPYQDISSGIVKAKNGDILYILTGIYYEQITIDKQITIIGEDKEKTIIDGQYQEYAIKNIVDNINIEKLTIRNTGGYEGNSGIIIQANNNKISDCIIKRTRTGIFLNNTEGSNISSCILYLNGEGIYTKSSENLKIFNSELGHNGIGINSRDSHNIEINHCYFHESGTGLFFNISSNVNMIDSAICDNNDNGGGFAAYNSKDFKFENCNIIHNGFGIRTINSSSFDIKNCDIQYMTHFGVWVLEQSKKIKISNCNLINNFRHCIYMTDSCGEIESSNLYNNQIESVYVKDALCVAKNNWWGGKLGPAFNQGFRIVDIINPKYNRLIYFPWSLNPYENVGSNWIVEDRFTKTVVHGYEDDPIALTGNDSDCDGLPDWWEEEFAYDKLVWDDHINLDSDGDALNNFEECYAYEWGATPNQKDLFLEMDYTVSKTPGASNILPDEYVEEMKERLAEHDIIFHVDRGLLGGGEEVPYITDFNFDELVDIYWDYFLHNDLNNPRKNIFHYGFICDQGPGSGFAFMGWGHLNAFCISADQISANRLFKSRGLIISSGSLHETGHTLGLVVDDFGGNDNHAAMKPKYPDFWYYRNYKSCMNYAYTYSILDFSDGDNGKVDYNDWEGMEFDFFKNTHFEWPKG